MGSGSEEDAGNQQEFDTNKHEREHQAIVIGRANSSDLFFIADGKYTNSQNICYWLLTSTFYLLKLDESSGSESGEEDFKLSGETGRNTSFANGKYIDSQNICCYLLLTKLS